MASISGIDSDASRRRRHGQSDGGRKKGGIGSENIAAAYRGGVSEWRERKKKTRWAINLGGGIGGRRKSWRHRRHCSTGGDIEAAGKLNHGGVEGRNIEAKKSEE